MREKVQIRGEFSETCFLETETPRSVDSRDGAIKVEKGRGPPAAFAPAPKLYLHRPGDVLRQSKVAGQLVDPPALRALDPRVELHGDGLLTHVP